MRLLFCIKAMNNPGGGAERVLAEVASGLAARGHDVSVLTFEQPGGRSFYFLREGVARISLGIGSTTRPATILETLRRMAALRRAVRAHRADVAIGFMHSMYVPLALALIGSGTPVVGSEHIVPAHYESRPLQRLLLAIIPALVAAVTTVSVAARNEFPRRLRARMIVVPNPLTAKPMTADVVGRGKPKRVLSVGRLVSQKDHVTLIRAFAAVCDDFPEWSLRIVGSGELEDELGALIADLALSERARLAGSIPDISSEYAAAQLFVVPSRYESFGLATAEALVHGLPVIGFADCPGTNELVHDGVNGRLVSGPDRVAALAAAMRSLMADADERQRLSQAGAAEILAAHGTDGVLRRWESLLANVQGGAAGPGMEE